MMNKVILIEDDETIRTALAGIVSGSGTFQVVASFESAEEAMNWCNREDPAHLALVLTDIQLPDKSGIDFIAWFKPKYPAVQCMVLTAFDDAEKVFSALKVGATGYILKSTPAPKLIEAMNDLVAGGSPMSSQIARKVVAAFSEKVHQDPMKDLTSREKEVLDWLSKGLTYQEIADKMFLSIETIRTHIRNMYEKLRVRNKKEALRKTGY